MDKNRSEEHTSELQSPALISYAVFCLKKIFFFFNDTATTEIYTISNTLSLHDALPIYTEQVFAFLKCTHMLHKQKEDRNEGLDGQKHHADS